jgi:hypothetical protein
MMIFSIWLRDFAKKKISLYGWGAEGAQANGF